MHLFRAYRFDEWLASRRSEAVAAGWREHPGRDATAAELREAAASAAASFEVITPVFRQGREAVVIEPIDLGAIPASVPGPRPAPRPGLRLRFPFTGSSEVLGIFPGDSAEPRGGWPEGTVTESEALITVEDRGYPGGVNIESVLERLAYGVRALERVFSWHYHPAAWIHSAWEERRESERMQAAALEKTRDKYAAAGYVTR